MVSGTALASAVATLPPGGAMDEHRTLHLALELMQHENLQLNTFVADPTQYFESLTEAERASKRSQNMTECVGVPSSEHVAEIVGRQGTRYFMLKIRGFVTKCIEFL